LFTHESSLFDQILTTNFTPQFHGILKSWHPKNPVGLVTIVSKTMNLPNVGRIARINSFSNQTLSLVEQLNLTLSSSSINVRPGSALWTPTSPSSTCDTKAAKSTPQLILVDTREFSSKPRQQLRQLSEFCARLDSYQRAVFIVRLQPCTVADLPGGDHPDAHTARQLINIIEPTTRCTTLDFGNSWCENEIASVETLIDLIENQIENIVQ